MRISDWSSDVCSSDLSKLARDLANDSEEILDGGGRLALASLQEADGPAGKLKGQIERHDLAGSHLVLELRHRAEGDLIRAEQQLADQGIGACLHRTLRPVRSEEHTSELQSLMRISHAVFCLKKKPTHTTKQCT